MDHAEAMKSRAAERYLLNELSGPERDAFEEHYFCCTECGNDVKLGAQFLDNAREVLTNEVPAVSSSGETARFGWLDWLRPAYAWGAVALLVVAVGYQNLITIPRLRQEAAADVPRALQSFSFVTQGSRAEGQLVIAGNPDQPLGMYVDIPAGGQFGSYVCQVRTEAGRPVFSVPISPEQARDTVQLLVPGFVFQPGNYVLVIDGQANPVGPTTAAGIEIARYPFVFQNKR